MSKQTYTDGDIVWVKLSNSWWPAQICDKNNLPEGYSNNVKRKPFAIVKFFHEESYEYVKSFKSLHPYNCVKKNEFIKKGLDLYRCNNKFMDKFPSDVQSAERLTGGDETIIDSDEFRNSPRSRQSIVTSMFGEQKSPKRSSPKKRTPNASPSKPTGSHLNASPSKPPPRPLNDTPSPIIVSPSKPSSPPTTVTIMPIPTTYALTPETQFYMCKMCDFTTKRQNAFIAHYRSHRSAPLVAQSHAEFPSIATTSRRPRRVDNNVIVINDEEDSDPDVIEVIPAPIACQSIESSSSPEAVLPEPIIRKGILKRPSTSSQPEIVTTKRVRTPEPDDNNRQTKKLDEEMRRALLADWSDDDEKDEAVSKLATEPTRIDKEMVRMMKEESARAQRIDDSHEKGCSSSGGGGDDARPKIRNIPKKDRGRATIVLKEFNNGESAASSNSIISSVEEKQSEGDSTEGGLTPEKEAVVVSSPPSKAPISCFDFEEDEDETTTVLATISKFKKKYLSPEKNGDEKSPEKHSSPEKQQCELDKKDKELNAEIESLLNSTEMSVKETSPSTSANVVDEVRALPIKERGKRIFKSRNRSRFEENAGAGASGASRLSIDANNHNNDLVRKDMEQELLSSDNAETAQVQDLSFEESDESMVVNEEPKLEDVTIEEPREHVENVWTANGKVGKILEKSDEVHLSPEITKETTNGKMVSDNEFKSPQSHKSNQINSEIDERLDVPLTPKIEIPNIEQPNSPRFDDDSDDNDDDNMEMAEATVQSVIDMISPSALESLSSEMYAEREANALLAANQVELPAELEPENEIECVDLVNDSSDEVISVENCENLDVIEKVEVMADGNDTSPVEIVKETNAECQGGGCGTESSNSMEEIIEPEVCESADKIGLEQEIGVVDEGVADVVNDVVDAEEESQAVVESLDETIAESVAAVEEVEEAVVEEIEAIVEEPVEEIKAVVGPLVEDVGDITEPVVEAEIISVPLTENSHVEEEHLPKVPQSEDLLIEINTNPKQEEPPHKPIDVPIEDNDVKLPKPIKMPLQDCADDSKPIIKSVEEIKPADIKVEEPPQVAPNAIVGRKRRSHMKYTPRKRVHHQHEAAGRQQQSDLSGGSSSTSEFSESSLDSGSPSPSLKTTTTQPPASASPMLPPSPKPSPKPVAAVPEEPKSLTQQYEESFVEKYMKDARIFDDNAVKEKQRTATSIEEAVVSNTTAVDGEEVNKKVSKTTPVEEKVTIEASSSSSTTSAERAETTVREEQKVDDAAVSEVAQEVESVPLDNPMEVAVESVPLKQPIELVMENDIIDEPAQVPLENSIEVPIETAAPLEKPIEVVIEKDFIVDKTVEVATETELTNDTTTVPLASTVEVASAKQAKLSEMRSFRPRRKTFCKEGEPIEIFSTPSTSKDEVLSDHQKMAQKSKRFIIIEDHEKKEMNTPLSHFQSKSGNGKRTTKSLSIDDNTDITTEPLCPPPLPTLQLKPERISNRQKSMYEERFNIDMNAPLSSLQFKGQRKKATIEDKAEAKKEQIQVNIDMHTPLSSQLANFLTNSRYEARTPKKRKQTVEDDIPSFLIERSIPPNESFHNDEIIDKIVPKPNDDNNVFDINNMPIVLSGDAIVNENMQLVITPSTKAAGTVQNPLKSSPPILRTNARVLSRHQEGPQHIIMPPTATMEKSNQTTSSNKKLILFNTGLNTKYIVQPDAISAEPIGRNSPLLHKRNHRVASATVTSPQVQNSSSQQQQLVITSKGTLMTTNNTTTTTAGGSTTNCGGLTITPIYDTSGVKRVHGSNIKPTLPGGGGGAGVVKSSSSPHSNLIIQQQSRIVPSPEAQLKFVQQQQQILLQQQQQMALQQQQQPAKRRGRPKKTTTPVLPAAATAPPFVPMPTSLPMPPSKSVIAMRKTTEASTTTESSAVVPIYKNQQQTVVQKKKTGSTVMMSCHSKDMLSPSSSVEVSPQQPMLPPPPPPPPQLQLHQPQQVQIHQLVIEPDEGIDDQQFDENLSSKILAVPATPYGGFMETFLLCTLVNHKYVPMDNKAMYLNHEMNQLVPIPKDSESDPTNVCRLLDEYQNRSPSPSSTSSSASATKRARHLPPPQLLVFDDESRVPTSPPPPPQRQLAPMEVPQMRSSPQPIIYPQPTPQKLIDPSQIEIGIADCSDEQYSDEMPAKEVTTTAPTETVIISLDGQQVMIDYQTFLSLVTNNGSTQLLTADGEQFVLTEEALVGFPGEANGGQQQNDGDDDQMAAQPVYIQGDINSDIIASALANSAEVVYQQNQMLGPGEILQIETSQGLQLIGAGALAAEGGGLIFQSIASPSTAAQTSETNAVLNQTPIMSALEVPSTNGAATMNVMNEPADLEDSLAVIGVTGQSSIIPSSLELPITVTNPAIAANNKSSSGSNSITLSGMYTTTTTGSSSLVVAHTSSMSPHNNNEPELQYELFTSSSPSCSSAMVVEANKENSRHHLPPTQEEDSNLNDFHDQQSVSGSGYDDPAR